MSHLCYEKVACLGLFLHCHLEVTGLGLIPTISEFRSRRMSLKRNMIIFFFFVIITDFGHLCLKVLSSKRLSSMLQKVPLKGIFKVVFLQAVWIGVLH